MEVFIDGQKCIKVVNADGLDMNVVFVSESGNLLLVYGKVDNIVYFDKKLAGMTPRPAAGCDDNNCGQLPHVRNAVFHAAW